MSIVESSFAIVAEPNRRAILSLLLSSERFRWEIFNMFNRFRPSTGSTNIQDPNFGRVQSQLNEPRRMQLRLKLYF